MTDNKTPARRMRHGDRPEQPLYFGPETGQPRRWAALITSAGHGMLQEYGTKFEYAQPGQEVLEVMEILPGAANKAAEESGLSALDSAVMAWLETKDEPNKCCRESFVDGFIAADRASRQVANKAEVEPESIHGQEFHELAMSYRSAPAFNGAPEAYRALIEHVDQHVASQVQAALATPPATTGASIARDQALEEAAEAIDAMNDASGDAAAYDGREQNLYELEREHAISACAEKVRSLKGSPPASTVLTDERILRISEETALNYVTDERRPDNSTIIEFAREIEREVAAQAGQVAVPEGAAVDGNGTTYHNVAETYYQAEVCEALHMWLDDKGAPRLDADGRVFSPVGRVAGFVQDAERFRWLNHDHDDAGVREKARELAERMGTSSYFAITRDIDVAMLAAAPSPAKESK